MSTLYIVATPIGNLEDLTFRALRILKEVDLILCEDTRVTKKLLDHYQIKTSILSYHQHSKLQKLNYILKFLKKEKKVALVTDAGTPGISDPGNNLIKEIVKFLADQVKIVPIPGPSAITCAASVSGLSMDRFIFMGFPPTKKKRNKFFKEIINSKYPVIFYESPHRIIKSLRELNSLRNLAPLGQREFRVVVCKELTKKFEEIFRGTTEEVLEQLQKSEIKGEFVVIVGK